MSAIGGPYMNEDGDWWVAVEDASFKDARRAVVNCLGYTIPEEGTLLYTGRETVTLWEGEPGDTSLPSRHVEAWHFQENPRGW